MCQVIQFHEAELAFYKLTMYLSFEKFYVVMSRDRQC